MIIISDIHPRSVVNHIVSEHILMQGGSDIPQVESAITAIAFTHSLLRYAPDLAAHV